MDIRKERPEPPPSANPDPITKEPGSHPVGTGVGSASGAAAGAAIGAALGGPVGAVVGGAAGAVAGGAAGHAAGESVNPTVEDAYWWREHFNHRPYDKAGRKYSDFEPAYRYGWENASRSDFADKKFEDVERDLEAGWDRARGNCTLDWVECREAMRDAWYRVRGGN